MGCSSSHPCRPPPAPTTKPTTTTRRPTTTTRKPTTTTRRPTTTRRRATTSLLNNNGKIGTTPDHARWPTGRSITVSVSSTTEQPEFKPSQSQSGAPSAAVVIACILGVFVVAVVAAVLAFLWLHRSRRNKSGASNSSTHDDQEPGVQPNRSMALQNSNPYDAVKIGKSGLSGERTSDQNYLTPDVVSHVYWTAGDSGSNDASSRSNGGVYQNSPRTRRGRPAINTDGYEDLKGRETNKESSTYTALSTYETPDVSIDVPKGETGYGNKDNGMYLTPINGC